MYRSQIERMSISGRSLVDLRSISRRSEVDQWSISGRSTKRFERVDPECVTELNKYSNLYEYTEIQRHTVHNRQYAQYMNTMLAILLQ